MFGSYTANIPSWTLADHINYDATSKRTSSATNAHQKCSATQTVRILTRTVQTASTTFMITFSVDELSANEHPVHPAIIIILRCSN